jgi:hypothetical protein
MKMGSLKTITVSLAVVALTTSMAYADEAPECDIEAKGLPVDATLSGHVDSVGFIVGARWGDGVLKLANGDEKSFDIIGAKALETGASATDFTGEVYNLKNLADFDGTYYGASAKITVIAGDGEGVFNNANCVIVKLKASGKGLQLSAPGAAAVHVSLDD